MGDYVNPKLEAYAYHLEREGKRGVYVKGEPFYIRHCPTCGASDKGATCYGEFGYYERTCIMTCACGTRYVT